MLQQMVFHPKGISNYVSYITNILCQVWDMSLVCGFFLSSCKPLQNTVRRYILLEGLLQIEVYKQSGAVFNCVGPFRSFRWC